MTQLCRECDKGVLIRDGSGFKCNKCGSEVSEGLHNLYVQADKNRLNIIRVKVESSKKNKKLAKSLLLKK